VCKRRYSLTCSNDLRDVGHRHWIEALLIGHDGHVESERFLHGKGVLAAGARLFFSDLDRQAKYIKLNLLYVV
jgi:hypothetical protein